MRLRFATTTLLIVIGLACQNGSAAQQAASKPAGTPLKPAELDSLLAPVALYPDQLLAQMFLCASDPAMVVKLSTWMASNSGLAGAELQDAATVAGFEAQFVMLTMFPNVVNFMAKEVDWTTRLGKAFAADRAGVFDSVQRLRKNAQEKGALKSTPQQTVENKTTPAGQEVIVVEPANPQVVYVPQYNPQVVYTSPPTTTVVVQEDDDDADAAVAGLIGFTAGIAIGAAIDNDYYYGPYGWHGGAYMYNDAWDDYYDAREDAREDWMDHREDLAEERGERSRDNQEQRTERTEARQEGRSERQGNRTPEQQAAVQQRATEAKAAGQQRRADAQASGTQTRSSSGRTSTYSGSSSTTRTAPSTRSSTSSDAFSGYSSGRSERAASSRGSSSRSGGGRGGGGRGGGGRRR